MPKSRGGLPAVSAARLPLLLGIALLAFSVVFCGCTQPVIPSPSPPQTTAPPGVTAPVTILPQVTTARATQPGGTQTLTYENSQSGFRMSYPATWTKVESSGGSGVTFQAPSEGKDDLIRENMRVTVTDLAATPMSLTQYVDDQITRKKQGIDNYNPTHDENIRVGGFNGRKVSYTGYQGSSLMRWVEIYTMKGTTAYVLTFSSQESHYQYYVSDMENMIKTFEFV